MIEATLKSYLLDQSGLTDLIGKRLYAGVLPQKPKYPAIVYQDISNIPSYSHDGDCNLDRTLFQFKCFDNTKLGSLNVYTQLRAVLSGISDRTLDDPIHSSFQTQKFTKYDDTVKAWFTLADFRIRHEV